VVPVQYLYLRSRGRGFDSRLGTRRKNVEQVSHTYVPLSPSSISWYWPKGPTAGKVTAGLAESNGSLPQVNNMHVCVAVGLVGGGGSLPPGS